MVLAIRELIELRGYDALEATIAGTQHKAYLVANLALNDGPQAAADHYRPDLLEGNCARRDRFLFRLRSRDQGDDTRIT